MNNRYVLFIFHIMIIFTGNILSMDRNKTKSNSIKINEVNNEIKIINSESLNISNNNKNNVQKNTKVASQEKTPLVKQAQGYVRYFLPCEITEYCSRDSMYRSSCSRLFDYFNPSLEIDYDTRKKEVAQTTYTILKDISIFYPIAQEAIINKTLEGLDRCLKNQKDTDFTASDNEIRNYTKNNLYPLLPDDLRGATENDLAVKKKEASGYTNFARAVYCTDPSNNGFVRDEICQKSFFETWGSIAKRASKEICKEKGFDAITTERLTQETIRNFLQRSNKATKEANN